MTKWQNSENSSEPLCSPIETTERVRYSETDQMGVAHNKSYFEWFEIGRTEYCRQKNIPYKSIEEQGIYLVVAESYCQYKRPLRYDERIIIRVNLMEALPKKIVFEYHIISLDRNRLAAKGRTVHVPTNAEAKVTRLPDNLLQNLSS